MPRVNKRKMQDILDPEKVFTAKITVNNKTFEEKLFNILSDLEEQSGYYLNSDNIIKDFIDSISQNKEGLINRCTTCGIDMGRMNPRQLCGKTFCHFEEDSVN